MKALKSSEVTLPASEAAFFDESLVHQNDAEPRIPFRCRGLWSYLEEHRLRP